MKLQTTRRIFLYSIFRRGRLILSITAAILGLTVALSWLLPPTYQAESSIIILGRSCSEPVDATLKEAQESTSIFNTKEALNSAIEIIRSRPVLERVVQTLKLAAPEAVKEEGVFESIHSLFKEPGPQEALNLAVNRLRSRLQVELVADSQIIHLRYRDHDPVQAGEVVNRVAEEGRSQYLAMSARLHQAESSLFQEQIEKVEPELKGLEEQLLTLMKDSGMISYAEQGKALRKKLEISDNALAAMQKEIIQRQSLVDKIQALRQSDPELLIPVPELAQDPQIAELQDKLEELKADLETALARYSPKSRRVARLQRQIDEVEDEIRDQVSILVEQDTAKIKELRAEEQAIDRTIKAVKEELAQMPAMVTKLTNLERQIEVQQSILTLLRKKHQASLVARNADQQLGTFQIFSPAVAPLKPVSPNLPLNLGLGLALSLAVSLSTAFLLEYWDDSLKNPEDVERYLGRPVLASVPEWKS